MATTYEVVGDYVKRTKGPYTYFTYVKNADLIIDGPFENPSSIQITAINGVINIRNTRYETSSGPVKDENTLLPDSKGFIENVLKAAGIQGVSGASRHKTYRRRH